LRVDEGTVRNDLKLVRNHSAESAENIRTEPSPPPDSPKPSTRELIGQSDQELPGMRTSIVYQLMSVLLSPCGLFAR
jgi:hypothetical protein